MEFGLLARYLMARRKYFIIGCAVVLIINVWSHNVVRTGITNIPRRFYEKTTGPFEDDNRNSSSEQTETKRTTRTILATLEKLLTSVKSNRSTENLESTTIPSTNSNRLFSIQLDQAKHLLPGLDSMDKYLKLPPLISENTTDEQVYAYSQRRDYRFVISHNNSCSLLNTDNLTSVTNSTSDEENIFLLMVVKSICRSRERRDSVRATWGNESWIFHNLGVRVRVLFLLGACENLNDQESIISEDFNHSDILQWDFIDSFQNLTLKECLYLQWYANHCLKVPFIFKGDDDVFVNIQNIVRFLQQLQQNEAQTLFIGSKLVRSPRISRPRSKYFVSSDLYPEQYYPPYLSGGGFLLSGEVAVKFFIQSMQTRMIPIDDAFLGILSQSVGIEPRHDDSFKSWGIKNHSPCSIAEVKTFHRALPLKMISMWKDLTTFNMTECEK